MSFHQPRTWLQSSATSPLVRLDSSLSNTGTRTSYRVWRTRFFENRVLHPIIDRYASLPIADEAM
jgi:hypothetical protein